MEPDVPEKVSLRVSRKGKPIEIVAMAPGNNVVGVILDCVEGGDKLEKWRFDVFGTLSVLSHSRGERIDLTVDHLVPLSREGLSLDFLPDSEDGGSVHPEMDIISIDPD